MTPAQRAHARTLIRAAAVHRPARDGDCLIVADAVTAGLAADGVTDARSTWLHGWLSIDYAARRGLLAWSHRVTMAGNWVIDGTARQFSPALPDEIITPYPDYVRLMTSTLGLVAVTDQLTITADAA